MAWFKKKQSPIERRLDELHQQIAELEAQARRHEKEAARNAARSVPAKESNGQNAPAPAAAAETEKPPPQKNPNRPRFRTTATPSGVSPVHGIEPHEVDFFARPDKPVDFSLEPGQAPPARSGDSKKAEPGSGPTPKLGFIEDILRWFHKPKPPESIDRLAYLTTGSFQTLKPLKYERRVARNRFIVLVVILVVVIVLLARCVTRS